MTLATLAYLLVVLSVKRRLADRGTQVATTGVFVTVAAISYMTFEAMRAAYQRIFARCNLPALGRRGVFRGHGRTRVH